jgi:hypothetical protein
VLRVPRAVSATASVGFATRGLGPAAAGCWVAAAGADGSTTACWAAVFASVFAATLRAASIVR